MTTTTSDATPDTRLIARVEPPKASYGPAGSGPATRSHRDLRVRHACDKARTERGWSGPRGVRAVGAFPCVKQASGCARSDGCRDVGGLGWTS